VNIVEKEESLARKNPMEEGLSSAFRLLDFQETSFMEMATRPPSVKPNCSNMIMGRESSKIYVSLISDEANGMLEVKNNAYKISSSVGG
jgi:hypothetical protein